MSRTSFSLFAPAFSRYRATIWCMMLMMTLEGAASVAEEPADGSTFLRTIRRLPPNVQIGFVVLPSSLRMKAIQYGLWAAVPAVVLLFLFGSGKPITTTDLISAAMLGVITLFMAIFFQEGAQEEEAARAAGQSEYQLVLHGPEAFLPGLMILIVISPILLIAALAAAIGLLGGAIRFFGTLIGKATEHLTRRKR